jgi:ABC-2 type transport system permease protein
MDKIKHYCAQIWNATRNTRIIMKKELRSYFISPIAYIVIALFLVLSGVMVFPAYFLNNQADLRGFFDLLPFLFAFFLPIITMRLFAEERNTGTLEMLITMPFTTWDIIFGKIAAATVFSIVMLVPTFIYPISIFFVGSPDIGPIIGGYIGAIFLGAAFASIGVFTSSLTRNQIIAVILALVISVFLAFLHKLSVIIPASIVDAVEFIGAGYHYSSIGRGVVDTRDVLYFASVVAVFAMATSRVIEERR